MEKANVKLTKAQKYGMLLELLGTEEGAGMINNMFGDNFSSDDAKEFINHELDLLAKKAGKKAKTEDTLKAAIVSVLNDSLQSGMAIMGLVVDQHEDVTQAKVTARLSALVREGVAVKEALRVGKSTIQHYRLVSADDVAE